MVDMDISGDERAKTLMLLKVYLLEMQKDIGNFYDKQNIRINGLVFEIDRALSSKE